MFMFLTLDTRQDDFEALIFQKYYKITSNEYLIKYKRDNKCDCTLLNGKFNMEELGVLGLNPLPLLGS